MLAQQFILLFLLSGVIGDYLTSKLVPNNDTDYDGNTDNEDLDPSFMSTPRYHGSTYKYGRYRTTRSSYDDESSRRYRGSTQRYSYGYYRTTESPDFDSTRKYRSRNPFKRYVNLPYSDLTEVLNTKNETEIKNALNLTTHIYYSTDSLISNIMNLSWVPRLINETLSNDQEESIHFCLMISFRIVQNKSNVDWRYMEDVLLKPNNIRNSEDHENLELFRKHLCKVALDFQVDDLNNMEYHRSQDYLHKNRISFTKYAKKILAGVLGSNIPVGVIHTEHQVFDDYHLKYREIDHSDFQIISVTYTPLSRMPLIFELFEKHFLNITTELKRQSDNTDRSRDRIIYDTSFMLVWKQDEEIKSIENTSVLSDMEKARLEVFRRNENQSIDMFKTMIYAEVHFFDYKIGIISGMQFDVRTYDENRINPLSRPGKLYAEILPTLHIQETDVSPCQLRKMLNRISTVFESLVVDEYTWSAIISYYDQLSDNQLMNKTCKKVSKLNLPNDVMLFASRGIGKYWNHTHKVFESLLWDNPSVGKINLTVVVFSAVDIFESTLNGNSTDYDIIKFVKSWKQANMSSIGCLVDVSMDANFRYPNSIIANLAEDRCAKIFDESSILVWEYKVDRMISAYNFTYKMDGFANLKIVLIDLLISRELFLKRNPQKEVIFSINMDDYPINSGETENREIQWTLFNWARINGVKLMFKPAYDLKNPRNGYLEPPGKNGENQAFTIYKY